MLCIDSCISILALHEEGRPYVGAWIFDPTPSVVLVLTWSRATGRVTEHTEFPRLLLDALPYVGDLVQDVLHGEDHLLHHVDLVHQALSPRVLGYKRDWLSGKQTCEVMRSTFVSTVEDGQTDGHTHTRRKNNTLQRRRFPMCFMCWIAL